MLILGESGGGCLVGFGVPNWLLFRSAVAVAGGGDVCSGLQAFSLSASSMNESKSFEQQAVAFVTGTTASRKSSSRLSFESITIDYACDIVPFDSPSDLL